MVLNTAQTNGCANMAVVAYKTHKKTHKKLCSQNSDSCILCTWLDNSFWHSLRVPPDCTRSSTMTTCRPLGSPSFSLTMRLSPSLTLVQITCTRHGMAFIEKERKEEKRKRKDYTFRHQFNEQPSIILGCPQAFTALSNYNNLSWYGIHCTLF